MTFPPPQDPHGSGSPGTGGGFGPPPGYGPPEQPGPPQGFGPPGGGHGGFGQPPAPYGPGQPGYGAGPYPYGAPQPPPGGGNGGAKVAAIVVGAVLVAAVAVGGVILLTSGDDGDENASEAKPDSSSSSPAQDEEGGGQATPTPDASEGSASPSASPGDLVPFVVLDPGECFDHPALSSKVTEVETRSCDGPHNGEVIANDTLTGDFASEKELRSKVLELCEADASERLKSVPQDGKSYYYYAIYPSLDTYEVRGSDTISCSLTLSNSLDGPKLTKPLPG